MKKCRTPSFILEKKLLTSKDDEEVLGLRFFYAVRIQIQLVKHARVQSRSSGRTRITARSLKKEPLSPGKTRSARRA